MRYAELKRLLKKSGCYKKSEGTRHEEWLSPKTDKIFSVGRHDSAEVPIGTLNAIFDAAGIDNKKKG